MARSALGLGVLLCLMSGFLGAVLSLFATATAGAITAVLGVLLVQQRRTVWGVVAICGIAILVGAGAYVLLGILQPDGAPASRS